MGFSHSISAGLEFFDSEKVLSSFFVGIFSKNIMYYSFRNLQRE
ncbi:hypothetical protein LEP1GSC061_1553 [Leptospira wolffii serovar Khorat str. Khorat-H2]|nr:hypothetical protein LEP1GSC061_1553 [Leptospira wolffii serovar Khorat str. Khorat-H2]